MPTNEFDLSVRPEYVSNRLAIPFNELNAMASQHQKEYDNAEDSAYKFKDLMASVKAIHDPSLGLSNIGAKDALYSKYAPRIEAISNEIAKGTNIGEANRKLSQLQREWINDPTRVELENSYGNYTKYVEDKTKKGGKYDQLLDDYRNTKLVDEKGNLKPFRFNGMDESLDVPKRFKEIMGNITQDVKSWDVESLGIDGIKIGNKGKRAGVDETKVNKVVDNKISLALNTDEGRQFVKKLKKINPNISEKEILNETRKQLFSSAYEQIGSEKMDGNSVDPTVIWSANHKAAQDKVVLENALRPSTLDGVTQNAISSDSDFNSLFKNEIFKDNNGIITFNPKMLTENPAVNQSVYTGSMGSHRGGNVSVSNKTTAEKSELLVKQLKKMAKATGKDYRSLSKDGKLDTNAVTELASAYNQLSKSRSLDLIMSPAVQSSESEYANLHWRDLKQVNPDRPEQSIAPEPLGENQEVVITNRRTDKNGKMYQEGYIRDKKTGEEIKPVTYRSNMTEKNLVFDAMGSMQKASIDNLSEDNYLQDKSGKDLTVVYNGIPMKIFKEESIGGGKYIQGITNPNDKRQVIYTVRDKNTNKILSTERSNLAELKKDVEEHYYTNTPEGNTELENLKSLMEQAKEQQGN